MRYPAYCVWFHSLAMVLGGIIIQAEQAKGCKQVAASVHGLCFSPYVYFPCLVRVFITATES